MSDSRSGSDCQIPGCDTTHAEIEAELHTYLSGYCKVRIVCVTPFLISLTCYFSKACEKLREGRLCGCAFPCNLTFKGQMLNMIHSLLGMCWIVGIIHNHNIGIYYYFCIFIFRAWNSNRDETN